MDTDIYLFWRECTIWLQCKDLKGQRLTLRGVVTAIQGANCTV